jgi:hypothetical protein
VKNLIEKAVNWVDETAAYALNMGWGKPLSAACKADAILVGVQRPENIQLVSVKGFPLPEDPELSKEIVEAGVISDKTVGLTLGYTILILETHWHSRRLRIHEFTHVAQYERLGGLEGFLEEYIRQVKSRSYRTAPLELEAVGASYLVPEELIE